LADSQKTEIERLRIEVGALKQRVQDARDEMKSAQDRHYAAAQRAERVLAEKEAELSKRTCELSERASFADARNAEIIALKSELEALEERLNGAGKELRVAEHRHYAAAQEEQRALANKESQLAKRMQELAEQTASAERQENEIAKLKTEVKSLQERLNGARTELKVLSDNRDADRTAATQKLMEARGKFETFHGRVAELVEQVTLQSSQDKIVAGRAQELEERLSTQSRVLDEREAELGRLSREVEIAREAEADLRAVIIKIENHENTVAQNLTAEKAKLQAALERANGERVRLAYELTDLRRRLTQNGRSAQKEASPLNGNGAGADRAA
jgi:chromosome segregation ATPase